LAAADAIVKTEAAAQKTTTANESIVAKEANTYEDAALAPLAAPVARMCYYSTPAAVPGPHAAGPRTDAPPPAHSPDPLPPVPGPDIGPGLLRAATIASAQVAQLQ